MMRQFRRRFVRMGAGRNGGRRYSAVLTLAVAAGVSIFAIQALSVRLRPMVSAAVQLQIHDRVTAVVQDTVLEELQDRATTYADLVEIRYNENGDIAALTARTAEMNRIQAQLVKAVLSAVQGIQTAELAVPVGSVLNWDPLWGRGPGVQVRAMWVGTVEVAFRSSLDSAGVNQSCHRIWMDIHVPIKVLLPGGIMETAVDSSVQAAETVIVGRVPDAYLNWNTAA